MQLNTPTAVSRHCVGCQSQSQKLCVPLHVIGSLSVITGAVEAVGIDYPAPVMTAEHDGQTTLSTGHLPQSAIITPTAVEVGPGTSSSSSRVRYVKRELFNQRLRHSSRDLLDKEFLCAIPMDNGDWFHWTEQSRQQQPYLRVRPQTDEWIEIQQNAERFRVHSLVENGSGDHVPPTPAWLEEIMRELSTASTEKQIAVGSFSGWCSGYLVGRVGKAAALAVGGSLIILTIAHNQGLIKVNWNSVQQRVESSRRKFGQHVTNSNVSSVLTKIYHFGQRHVFLAGSFGAGFLIGLAM